MKDVMKFKDAVEDYLEICKRNGKKPDKTYKGSFNIRISPTLHKQAVEKALIEGKSLNNSKRRIPLL